MIDKGQLTPAKHRKQIEAYREEFPCYETYAKTLKRVLENACVISFPDAFVQSRAKTISSFAEKVARRFDTYPDGVHQMTDLCGGRVIVQTMEQVKAVRQFIEANFVIVEKDDKALSLSEDKFGYRDMHYIVELRPDRMDALGITPEERTSIGGRKAEIQVRTWVQHAWADTLHDRIYKNKLSISANVKRMGALLAALLEESDRSFDSLADELDGLIANYTAFAPRSEVEKEIRVQELVLSNEFNEKKKPGVALKLARIVAACGEDARVV
jgi:putative GTP pyrophosphokinase